MAPTGTTNQPLLDHSELVKRGRRRRSNPSPLITGYDYSLGAGRWKHYREFEGNFCQIGVSSCVHAIPIARFDLDMT
jgi:hypothetical protein